MTVSRYVLPKFKVGLAADRTWYQPGDTVRISLNADYTFGKPVDGGKVNIVADEFIERFREPDEHLGILALGMTRGQQLFVAYAGVQTDKTPESMQEMSAEIRAVNCAENFPEEWTRKTAS